MHTQEMVSYIQRKASGYSREEILNLLSFVYNYVYSSDVMQQTEYVDPATGMPPFLATTAGQVTYDCPANCRETIAIFTKDIERYYPSNYNFRQTTYVYGNKKYYRILVKSFTASSGAIATLTFFDNPGTTTQTYYHLFSIQPINLTSEDIQLIMPEDQDLNLIDGVLARVRDEKFGDKTDWQHFKRFTKPEMQARFNDGAQGRLHETQTRREYQHYPNYGYLRRQR